MASNIATNLIAFILVLGFLIFAHESGHFLLAKLFRVRVLVYSFGFGTRLFGFRRGETDYRVSLIPLGGYVRMAGDIPQEDGEQNYAPGDFLAAPKWQRFLILVAGPVANMLIAFLFLTGFYMAGTEVLRNSRAVLGEILPGRPAAKAGLKIGDVITEADGKPVKSWEDLKFAIAMNPDRPVLLRFQRSGKALETVVVPERRDTEYGSEGIAGVQHFTDTEIGRVVPGSAAARAGLREGDRIVGVNGRPVIQMGDLQKELNATVSRPLQLQIERKGGRIATLLPARASAKEVYPGFWLPTVTRKFGLSAAMKESWTQNVKMLEFTFITISRLFRLQGSVKDFSGPINIARISGEMLRTGWKAVVFLMASISLQLGFMNLLPVPGLDGGHIFILLIEGIARRELPLAVKERIQQVGFAVLATLMIFVIYHDVVGNVMRMWNN